MFLDIFNELYWVQEISLDGNGKVLDRVTKNYDNGNVIEKIIAINEGVQTGDDNYFEYQ